MYYMSNTIDEWLHEPLILPTDESTLPPCLWKPNTRVDEMPDSGKGRLK